MAADADVQAQQLIEATKRAIRTQPLRSIEAVRRLLEGTDGNKRMIAEAAVNFCVDGKPTSNPSWRKTTTWAKVMGACADLNARRE